MDLNQKFSRKNIKKRKKNKYKLYMLNSSSILPIIFLIIFVFFILYLRNSINKSNNNFLKGAMKLGDTLIWLRFSIFIVILVSLFLVFGKK